MIQKLLLFFKLIRTGNLFIVALTQYIIKYALIHPFIEQTALSELNFFFFVLSTICITASGYIINDIYDVATDTINKKERLILGAFFTKKLAMIWYIFLNISGLSLGIYIALFINKPLYTFIFIYCIFSLWYYSKRMKSSFLSGNIHIGILTALCIINVGLFDLLPIVNNNVTGVQILMKIILSYAAFAFILTLMRECVKDIEDTEGDRSIGAKTLAIVLGVQKTKKLLISLECVVIVAIGFWEYFQYSILQSSFQMSLNGEKLSELSVWGTDNISIIYTLMIQFLLILLVIKTCQANRKKEFHSLSQLCKLIMVMGILSIPIFTYLHLN